MRQLRGRYCQNCKIFTDNVEEEAVALVQSLMDQPAFEGSHVRIMPDVHMGKGITIGFSAPLGKYVNPNHIGVDIGCTVSTMELSSVIPPERYAEFERRVGEAIPTGCHINEREVINREEFYAFLNKEYHQVMADFPEMINPVETINEEFINAMLLRIGMNKEMFLRALPSLGGGNHFMEYGEASPQPSRCEDPLSVAAGAEEGGSPLPLGHGFFTAHCGSRNMGVKVCNYWARRASASSTVVSSEEFKETMSDVYSTTVCTGTLDESPMAYKPMEEIVRLIEPTVEILYFVKPKINIKATDEE